MKPLRISFANYLAASACALAALACPLAQASLINHGDGSFTDTDTGYLWRTLAQYDGLDYASALALLPTGYHAASEAELATLTAAAPADPAGYAADATAMGASPYGRIWGFYGDGTRYVWKFDDDTAWNSNAANASGWDNWNYAVPPGTAFAGLSLFAVNTAPAASPAAGEVPEPATLALFGLGLAFIARKRSMPGAGQRGRGASA
jgi:hypothetical protein